MQAILNAFVYRLSRQSESHDRNSKIYEITLKIDQEDFYKTLAGTVTEVTAAMDPKWSEPKCYWVNYKSGYEYCRNRGDFKIFDYMQILPFLDNPQLTSEHFYLAASAQQP